MFNELNECTATDKAPHPTEYLHAAGFDASDGRHLAAFPYRKPNTKGHLSLALTMSQFGV